MTHSCRSRPAISSVLLVTKPDTSLFSERGKDQERLEEIIDILNQSRLLGVEKEVEKKWFHFGREEAHLFYGSDPSLY